MSVYDPLTIHDYKKCLTSCCCCKERFWKSSNFSVAATPIQKSMGINMVPCAAGTDMCDKCDSAISSTGIAVVSQLSLNETEVQARL
mmetsp:Transcript_3510/g.4405  ORF Transcript_3510/g.4405 Transcript_3510/m.4405 type:complete len:87 (+) Transcript_3510:381-641(+)